MVEYISLHMQKNISIYIVLGFIVLLLGAGVIVRYQVVKDRGVTETVPVTDFASCLSAHGDLDVTGYVCTTATGEVYERPGKPEVTPTPLATTTASTTTTPTTTIDSLTLGVATTFLLHDAKALKNGPTVTLTAITDSRCKPGVQCIWAGEFSASWKIVNGTDTQTITLGTVRNSSQTVDSYTYTLTNTNDDHATLTVIKSAIARGVGTVTGTVTVGPICPVETIDHPCVVPPEAYTSRSVVVYASDNVTELESHALDATGHYALSLKPGTYGLQIRPAGIGAGEIKPVTVTAGKTSTIDFDIDTGIR